MIKFSVRVDAWLTTQESQGWVQEVREREKGPQLEIIYNHTANQVKLREIKLK